MALDEDELDARLGEEIGERATRDAAADHQHFGLHRGRLSDRIRQWTRFTLCAMITIVRRTEQIDPCAVSRSEACPWGRGWHRRNGGYGSGISRQLYGGGHSL